MYALGTDMRAPGFEKIAPDGAVLERIAHGLIFTEGPVWDGRAGALIWTDIRGDKILKWTPGVGTETMLEPTGKANGLTLDHENRIVVAGWGSRTMWRIEPDGSHTTLVSHYDGVKLGTPNDVVVKSDGSIWWTDTDGALFIPGMCGDDVQKYRDYNATMRLSPDVAQAPSPAVSGSAGVSPAGGGGGGSLSPVEGKGGAVTVVDRACEGPNGLCFSPNESILYINDTPNRNIHAYDVQPDGTLKNGRIFYTDTGIEPGVPDGMKVDVEGNVYCTSSAGVHVISPQGKLLGRIKVPEHVANFAWGDADFRTMYLTCREVVYRTRIGIPGVPHGEENRQKVLLSGR